MNVSCNCFKDYLHKTTPKPNQNFNKGQISHQIILGCPLETFIQHCLSENQIYLF